MANKKKTLLSSWLSCSYQKNLKFPSSKTTVIFYTFSPTLLVFTTIQILAQPYCLRLTIGTSTRHCVCDFIAQSVNWNCVYDVIVSCPWEKTELFSIGNHCLLQTNVGEISIYKVNPDMIL